MPNNTAIILILLSVGLFYTFTSGQYQDVKELRALAGEYQDVLDDASAIVKSRDDLLITYKSIPRSEIDRINKVLPDNVDTVRLALDLDGIASRYGISIKNIQATTDTSGNATSIVLPENVGAYDKVRISFGFVSKYENFARLLADLERNLRIMDVKGIVFQTSESGFYDFQITIETYWLR